MSKIINHKSHILNIFWFVLTTLVSIVLLEQNAILGFGAALVGGIVFGARSVLAREAKT